ncbi:gamma-glutamyl-gamma-aminobutyrate hydrolase family protein [Parabacteroides acidifaciens]|uniref:Gamma-glutamyl-gamma-aminobutyrate hydrolase family protein n=1 Tax=Parabacteroides acidifaciens TaxID=2290935 RepID=A0A3D8HF18_9BACT|nr:gamma-glutamyl-gamma-aminobutyrate hydrolase family protein [Parabacteroides acidifaciens]MBC8601735.1 gamma-glutamyl-gamma-aminobutyrate hydrolase family protein [Parabacteroides acidifaciens]RDU49569.1 gamma-glutamyl-gamma-aminobutyrate hydrolase family protein [Parabacteroides acidifaciens]
MKVRRPNLEALYREVDNYIPKKERLQPPRIGISANRKDGLSCIAETYVQAVLKAGGAPVLVPVITDIEALTAIINGLDGLVMSGGGDINPLYMQEEPIPALQDVDSYRDEYDLILLRLATNHQLPVMGICRGHQILNVAFGGDVYQDIHSQHELKLLKHSQTLPREQASHSVTLSDSTSKLSTILDGAPELLVNSFHHQAIKEPASEFIATATAPDGINEAMEHPEKEIFSVQWHPEAMAANDDEQMLKLFRHHVESSRLFKEAKRIHHRNVTLDSHTDTPMIFPGEFNIGHKEGGKVNLPLMEEGLIDAAIMVAYIPQGPRDTASLQKATDYAINRLQEIHRQMDINRPRMCIAYTPQEVHVLKAAGKKAIMLGLENGYAIGKDLENITRFRDMGVSYITLCHNGNNDICDSARGEAEWNGLSPFGKDVIRKMNELGILVDISHAAESTFYDALETSAYPIIASHSSARALCNHPRNLTDEQLKALAAQGGVVQVCLYKGFINEDAEKASLSDAIRHITHIVDLIGIHHVGIGSDFDGDGELIGCRASNELINITVRLIKEGYTENDIAKIWGGNLLRIMNKAQSASNNKI